MKRVLICIIGVFLLAGQSQAFDVTPTDEGEQLAASIVGSGMTIVPGTVYYQGDDTTAGMFTDGVSAGMGMESGIFLSNGSEESDAPEMSVLEFLFETEGEELYFRYVFASEEYENFADTATREREIRSLVQAMGELGLTESTIITRNERDTLKSGKNRIYILPFWQWAIEQNY